LDREWLALIQVNPSVNNLQMVKQPTLKLCVSDIYRRAHQAHDPATDAVCSIKGPAIADGARGNGQIAPPFVAMSSSMFKDAPKRNYLFFVADEPVVLC
jgi:hypothetical protein